MLTEAFAGLEEQDGTRLTLPDAPDLQQIVLLGDHDLPGFADEASFGARPRHGGRGTPAPPSAGQGPTPGRRDVHLRNRGRAEGRAADHEALIRFADGTEQTRFFLTQDDRIWTALPLFHIGGIAFSAATVYAGAKLVHTGFFRPELALDQIDARATSRWRRSRRSGSPW